MYFEKNVRAGKRILLISPEIILSNPSQPRKYFLQSELESLADSIRANGILQPITVRRRNDGYYELIAGERRLRAAVLVGLKEVPCIEVTTSEQNSAILALLENLQRQDLTFFEEAQAISRLIDEWGITQEEAAFRLGKAQSTLANKLRLLRIPSYRREQIIDAGLTERHARALLRIEDPETQKKALDCMIEKKLNVAQADILIDNMLNPVTKKVRKFIPQVRDVRVFFNTITKAVKTMQLLGVNAVAEREDQDDCTVYIIKIPKTPVNQKIA